MTASTIRPRPGHLAELTRGIRLPLPAIPEDHLLVLAEGLYKAFQDLCIQCLNTMTSGDEPEVTALIEARLNSMIDQNLIWRQLVQCVARGSENISFNGSHLAKRPDFSIYLSERKRNFPLVVEAKILDSPKRKTIASYCQHGLARFINGEYAWGNQEAFMIAYVRDGSSINTTLRHFLQRASMTPRYFVQQLPIHIGPKKIPDLAHTRHGRPFVYNNQTPPNNPGPISIWHLWLS